MTSWISSSAPRTSRNCSRRGTGSSSSGFTTRTANAPATRPRCCSRTPNCCNGSRAGATRTGSNPPPNGQPIHFHGHIVALAPAPGKRRQGAFLHAPHRAAGRQPIIPWRDAKFFNRQSPVALVGNEFFLLRNAPPNGVLKYLAQKPSVPVRKLEPPPAAASAQDRSPITAWTGNSFAWRIRRRRSLFLNCSTTPCSLRLLAHSARDKSTWIWNGHEWTPHDRVIKPGEKPEILDDPRLDPAVQWLRKLDWFMQEPGLWIGDANENFLGSLAEAWAHAPGRGRVSRQRRVSSLVPHAARAQAAPGGQRQRH